MRKTASWVAAASFDETLRSRWQNHRRSLSTGWLYCRYAVRRRLRLWRYIRVAVTIFRRIREHSRGCRGSRNTRPLCERLNRSLPPPRPRRVPGAPVCRGDHSNLVTGPSRIPITISRTNRRLGTRRRIAAYALSDGRWSLMLVGGWANNEPIAPCARTIREYSLQVVQWCYRNERCNGDEQVVRMMPPGQTGGNGNTRMDDGNEW